MLPEVIGNSSSGSFEAYAGNQVVLNAWPYFSGVTFEGWTGTYSGSGESLAITMPQSGVTEIAHFSACPQGSMSLSGAGQNRTLTDFSKPSGNATVTFIETGLGCWTRWWVNTLALNYSYPSPYPDQLGSLINQDGAYGIAEAYNESNRTWYCNSATDGSVSLNLPDQVYAYRYGVGTSDGGWSNPAPNQSAATAIFGCDPNHNCWPVGGQGEFTLDGKNETVYLNESAYYDGFTMVEEGIKNTSSTGWWFAWEKEGRNMTEVDTSPPIAHPFSDPYYYSSSILFWGGGAGGGRGVTGRESATINSSTDYMSYFFTLANGDYNYTYGIFNGSYGEYTYNQSTGTTTGFSCDYPSCIKVGNGTFVLHADQPTIYLNFSDYYAPKTTNTTVTTTTTIPPTPIICSNSQGACSGYNITFDESGLPNSGGILGSIECGFFWWLFPSLCNKLQWGVDFGGAPPQSSIGTSMSFYAQNGTYDYTIIPPANYTAINLTGTVKVAGNNTDVPVYFQKASVYNVTFTITSKNYWGGTSCDGITGQGCVVPRWSVTLNNKTLNSTSINMTFKNLPPGAYEYTVQSPSNWSATIQSGYVNITDKDAKIGVGFNHRVNYITASAQQCVNNSDVCPANSSVDYALTIGLQPALTYYAVFNSTQIGGVIQNLNKSLSRIPGLIRVVPLTEDNGSKSIPYLITINDSNHVQQLIQGFSLLTCPFKIASDAKAVSYDKVLSGIVNLINSANISYSYSGDLIVQVGKNVSKDGFGGNPCADTNLDQTLSYLESYDGALTKEAKAQIYGGDILSRGGTTNFDQFKNDYIVGLNFQELELTLKLSRSIQTDQIDLSGTGEVFNESNIVPQKPVQCKISNGGPCILLTDANFSQTVSVSST